MHILIGIGIGSALGGVCRYLLYQLIQTKSATAFPIGTFVINIVGCLLIGIVSGLCFNGNISVEYKTMLTFGFIGGFTTFSAFSNETLNLLMSDQLFIAIAYVLASVVFGVLSTYLGILIVKLVH